ncbi:MAG: tRNA lysidine(34) synthetase TilS [Desulfobulbaceae bacterium]|nr:tRNA lysidine(34) synthetase TilS [Desulfobulbaceae bacterium]HIJ78482.1 tRNA lysidine(34) synthetase TilS [Deltaproteobacteria bacterium]
MHPLEKKLRQVIVGEGLLVGKECWVVGVSAGSDSMALLHLLAELAGSLDLTLVAAYVDHGLRPGETPREIALVERTAADLGLACEIGRVEVRAHARDNSLSIEHAARELRYGFLGEIAKKYGAGKICVAHTADDQAEELLLRLIRGTGRAGLSGMPLLAASGVVRPLLAIAKKELLAYLAAKQLPFLEDSSNQGRIYLRNRVRLDLLPFLAAQFNPNIYESLRETAAILQDEEQLLAQMAGRAYGAVVRVEGPLPEHPTDLRVNLAALLAQPKALQRRIMEKACWQLGCRPSFKQIEQLLRLVERGEVGGRMHLAGGLRVSKDSESLKFGYPLGQGALRGDERAEQNSFAEVIVEPGCYLIAALGKELVLEVLEHPPADLTAAGAEVQYLDAAKVDFPLTVRSYRPGDRFYPLGGPGSKKVGDFFTDCKVAVARRWQEPVLADRHGIIALPGRRIDQRVALTETTDSVLFVKLQAKGVRK